MAKVVRKYVVKSCHESKAAAKKIQSSMHEKGLTAKIVKKTVAKKVKYCVESAGKKKK